MSAASRLLAEASHRPGCSTRATIYLATDSIQVLRESAAYAHEFDIFHLSERLVTRHNPRDGQALLWDRRIWQRYYWGQTAWTMRQAWQASVELLLLAHADAFVGKFTSNFFRAAYALRAAQCDCAPLFSSLDAPTCFDFGVRAGRNWEFPVENRVATKTVRLPNSSTFEC